MQLSPPIFSSLWSISFKKACQRIAPILRTASVIPGLSLSSSIAQFTSTSSTTGEERLVRLKSEDLAITSLASDKKHFSNVSRLGVSKMSETAEQGSSTGGDGDRNKCVFCRIVDGKEDNEIYYQDDEMVVFQDIKPASKHHFLVVTREHIRDSKSLLPSHLGLLERLVETGHKVLLEQMQKGEGGTNTADLDQIRKILGFHWPPFHTVSHLHLHVIAPSDQMGFIAKTIFRPNSYWFVTPEYVRERLEKMASTETKSNPSENSTDSK